MILAPNDTISTGSFKRYWYPAPSPETTTILLFWCLWVSEILKPSPSLTPQLQSTAKVKNHCARLLAKAKIGLGEAQHQSVYGTQGRSWRETDARVYERIFILFLKRKVTLNLFHMHSRGKGNTIYWAPLTYEAPSSYCFLCPPRNPGIQVSFLTEENTEAQVCRQLAQSHTVIRITAQGFLSSQPKCCSSQLGKLCNGWRWFWSHNWDGGQINCNLG